MKRLTTKEFIEKAKKVYGDKYNYSLVNYCGSNKKVKIICKIHGVFTQTPNNHLSKLQNCPKCTDSYFEKKTTAKVISDFTLKHGDKYDYSKIKYINSKVKVEIICEKHGSFYQTPNNHLKGQECPQCKKITTELFIEKSNNVHNNKYKYDLVKYENMNTKIDIICEKHGVFKQVPRSHLCGCGCPSCKESKGEREIRNRLNELDIKYLYQYSFSDCSFMKKLRFDFYIPLLNMCIEYDGEQHFRPIEFYGGESNFKKQKNRDLAKEKYCTLKGINLLRISYKDNIKNKMKKCSL